MSTNNAPWWIALFVWMGLSTYWHVCKIKEMCYEAAPVTTGTAESPAVEPLYITDGSGLDLRADGNFGFVKSGAEASMSQVRTELDSLVAYLTANPGKRLNVVGYYSSAETNGTTYPDLGIARAEGVKTYLVSQGANAEMLTTSSQLMGDIVFSPDSMRGGIDLVVKDPIPDSEEGLANAQKYEGVFKPMDLYFPTASANYIKTDANRQFIEEAQKYLATNPDKKLLLTGHSDNEGEKASNLRLSKQRAEGVKKQLIRTGIAAGQLVTEGKGETQPKESNNTAEGRRANRRVDIVVQ
ncbi:OmpA family protein [Persicitalea sp.]|uniref:OmpA family protein n=1 Tax=Persicitalea sp. TaxID=3100273 RepID=UPI0035947895